MSLGLSNVTTANLTDTGSGGNTFTVTGWTGSGNAQGHGGDPGGRRVEQRLLAKTSLAVTGLPTLTLSGFTTANLTDTARRQYIHGQRLDGERIADGQCSHCRHGSGQQERQLHSDQHLAVLHRRHGTGLSGITTANLAATSSGKTFTVSGWTGSGSLTDTASGIVTASKSAGFTLTNASLTSTDGMSLA